jgi:hypothetical protein
MDESKAFVQQAAIVLEGVAHKLRGGKFDRLVREAGGVKGLRVDWSLGGEVLVTFAPKPLDDVPCFIENPSPVIGEVMDASRPISYSRRAISSEDDVIGKAMECSDCGKRIIVRVHKDGPEISRASCEACVRSIGEEQGDG